MSESKPDEEAIFHAARRIPATLGRGDYLGQACGMDRDLQARVEVLLRVHDQSGDFLESPPEEIGPAAGSILEGPGTLIGPYKLLEQIGEGGFGVVFMAEQQQPLRRRVALKVIKPGMDTRQVVARFEAERQALALMEHPNIAHVLDGGQTASGRPYFVMELVRGVPINDFCDHNRLAVRQRLELFSSVCQAVQHAHQKGIIHRDIKPSNVLITLHDGTPVVKVIDFGVAKAMGQQLTEKTLFTAFVQMVGTPLYMSPEQAEMSGLDIDTRSDIYSLGVLLYELLTGTTPFDRERLKTAPFDEIRRIIREEEPAKPSTRISTIGALASTVSTNRQSDPGRLCRLLRGELDWIAMKCLEKDRARRYDTANAVARDIERYLHDEPVEASPPSTTYRLRKFSRRHKKALATLTALGVVLVAATATSIGLATWALQERSRAETQRQLAQAKESDAKQRADELRTVLDFVDIQVFAAARPLGQEGGLGRDVTMRQAIESALPYVEEGFRDQPLIEARLRTTIGASFLYLGDGKIAETQFERARQIRADKLGTDHPDTLSAMNSLGSSYFAQSRYREALVLQKETLQLQKARLGPDHPDTLKSMSNVALCIGALGRRDEALELLEEVFRLQKTKLGPDHADTLRSISNLGAFYRAAGRHADALKFGEEAVARRKAKYGPEHALTLHSMRNLAKSFAALGRHAEALNVRDLTLRVRKDKLGLDHPDTVASMSDLASSYHALGRNTDALKLFEETLPLAKAKFGPGGYETTLLMNELAQCYAALGRDDEASKVREEMRQAVKTKRGLSRPEAHPPSDNQK